MVSWAADPPKTHKERVLHLLSDGKPHSHHELYALHVVAHSRISDLRADGCEIDQWREGDNYFYRLLSQPASQSGAVPPETSARQEVSMAHNHKDAGRDAGYENSFFSAEPEAAISPPASVASGQLSFALPQPRELFG